MSMFVVMIFIDFFEIIVMFVDTGAMRTMGMAMGGIMVLNVHMVVLSHRVSVG